MPPVLRVQAQITAWVCRQTKTAWPMHSTVCANYNKPFCIWGSLPTAAALCIRRRPSTGRHRGQIMHKTYRNRRSELPTLRVLVEVRS